MIYFTSDQHFGHWNINNYCNRGFSSLEEMDGALIEGWNSVVEPKDTVCHLGDFCLGGEHKAEFYFSRLNGHISILGNLHHHDQHWLPSTRLPYDWLYNVDRPTVEILPPIYNLELPEYGDGARPKTIVLCHYPIRTWDKKHYGSWHLYGHVHERVQKEDPYELSLNVNVDAQSRRTWKPISLAWVINVMREMEKKHENPN